jgi:hypothetical protein
MRLIVRHCADCVTLKDQNLGGFIEVPLTASSRQLPTAPKIQNQIHHAP